MGLIFTLVFLLMIGEVFMSCSTSDSEPPQVETTVTAEAALPSLQAKLDARKAESTARMPEDLKKIFADGITYVANSGVMESALTQGELAPDFTVPNAIGDTVRLSELLANGPVILTWYRGGWCPYCNVQLQAYNDALPEFQKYGGQLVAISPEIPDSSLSTKERGTLAFEVLSDVDSKVARNFGVAYQLPQPLAERFGNTLLEFNNDSSNTLPLAVTYVIGTNGTIEYAFIDSDYKNRAEPQEILLVLKRLSEKSPTS
jgi:peroxiredoxin